MFSPPRRRSNNFFAENCQSWSWPTSASNLSREEWSDGRQGRTSATDLRGRVAAPRAPRAAARSASSPRTAPRCGPGRRSLPPATRCSSSYSPGSPPRSTPPVAPNARACATSAANTKRAHTHRSNSEQFKSPSVSCVRLCVSVVECVCG